jgi:hypothetical protein
MLPAFLRSPEKTPIKLSIPMVLIGKRWCREHQG